MELRLTQLPYGQVCAYIRQLCACARGGAPQGMMRILHARVGGMCVLQARVLVPIKAQFACWSALNTCRVISVLREHSEASERLLSKVLQRLQTEPDGAPRWLAADECECMHPHARLSHIAY